MSSKLIAGNATNGSSLSADTTGILEIQTGSTPTTAITVGSAQNVSIGTASANGQVQINAVSGQGTPLYLTSTDSTANTQVIFAGNRIYQIGTGNSGSGFSNSLYFYDGTAGAERMRIDSSGNVGIGTSSPNDVARASFGNSSATSPALWAAFFGTNSGGAAAAPNFGLTLGWNKSNSGGESNIVYGTGVGSNPALAFASSDGTTVTERMRIDSSGNLLVGLTTSGTSSCPIQSNGGIAIRNNSSGSTYKLYLANGDLNHWIYSSGSGGNVMYFGSYSSWNFTLTANSTTAATIANNGAYTQVSDAALKTNINPINYGLNAVMELKPVTYTYTGGLDKTDKVYEEIVQDNCLGFIAQDVQKVLPQLVDIADKEKNILSLQYSGLIPVLTKAIQELNAKVDAQAAEIQALKGVA